MQINSISKYFVLPVAISTLVSITGIEPELTGSGRSSASATSAEGTVTAEWNKDQLQIELTSSKSDAAQPVVTLNGVEIVDGNGDGELTVDRNEFPGDNLEVAWERPLEVSEIDSLDLQPATKSLAESSPELFVETSLVGIPLNESGTSNMLAPAQAATVPNSTSFRYMAFIREQYIDEAIWPGCELDPFVSYSYKGDSRGFNVNSSAYRTRFNVTINWLTNGTVSWAKSVGASHQYKKNSDGTYTLNATKTADSTSMVVSTISQSATITKFRMTQDVMNPFCAPAVAAGIYFDYTVNVARTGSYSVSGSALRVPNHEFYVMDSDQTVWTTIFARTGPDFGCLAEYSAPTATCRNGTGYSGLR